MRDVLLMAINYFADFLYFLIFVRVILSWIRIGKNSELVRLVYNLTEPMLGPIRNLLAKSPLGGPGMALDFSPFLALMLILGVSNALTTFVGAVL